MASRKKTASTTRRTTARTTANSRRSTAKPAKRTATAKTASARPAARKTTTRKSTSKTVAAKTSASKAPIRSTAARQSTVSQSVKKPQNTVIETLSKPVTKKRATKKRAASTVSANTPRQTDLTEMSVIMAQPETGKSRTRQPARPGNKSKTDVVAPALSIGDVEQSFTRMGQLAIDNTRKIVELQINFARCYTDLVSNSYRNLINAGSNGKLTLQNTPESLADIITVNAKGMSRLGMEYLASAGTMFRQSLDPKA